MNSAIDPTSNIATQQSVAAITQALDGMLAMCVQSGASDLHLSSGRPPYVRLHGQLAPIPGSTPLSLDALKLLSIRLIGPHFEQALTATGSADGAFTFTDSTRFRFNVYRREGELSIALRRLEDRLHTLAELGLSDLLYEVCDQSHGLVVVAGPTGSGKSTTLATLVDRVNRTRPCHIITIEDPIEYLHPPAKSLVDQRQVGIDASSFNDALVAALRQDPDVILVGEIRELNTIRTAITASETGHLVLTTVHAGDCIGAVERLVSVFPADEQTGVRKQLALVLRWIIAQQLLVADGARVLKDAEVTGILSRRRVVASEVMKNTSAVANLIANGKSSQIISAIEAGTSVGMQTIEHDLARLWMQGFISETTAQTLARNSNVLRERALLYRQRGFQATDGSPSPAGGRPSTGANR
ncbi:type IV pilus twitching motility protein PilT [Anatilimnocola floriformis]|uniref:type IV pilus twitching motility protein PilT n=1 Tax=Anatilimnocola floriformis TaxID=2948575 RepID=UPI0020C56ECF|nr:PilT/PilU family type 4a pilus ATPase [Anatilimnocola floriformis]